MFDKYFLVKKSITDFRNLSKYVFIKITIIYALAGAIWILLSNIVLHLFIKTAYAIVIIQIHKGLVYVAVTAYLFYRISAGYIKHIEKCEYRLNTSEKDLSQLTEKLLAIEMELNSKYAELQNKDETIRLWEEKYKLIVEGTSDTVWEWDFVSGMIYFNEGLTKTLGYGNEERFEYSTFMNIIHPNDRLRLNNDIETIISGRTLYFQCEFRIKTRMGCFKWVLCTGKGLKNIDGNIDKIIGSLSDITERKESEEKLLKLVYYDNLTGLQNKALFEEKLDNVLIEANNTGKQGSILFIDLDDFKKVNDSLGHDYGDQLVKLTAQMLMLTVGQHDEVFRFGGDEFIILHPQSEDAISDAELAKKILDIFVNPFEIGEKQIYVSAGIGISSYPNDGIEVSTILKNADAAMYEAKRTGKNAYYFYNKKAISEIIRKNELEKRMRIGIENNEFYLFYQPQLDLKTGEITSLEALIRWGCPEYGIVMPAEFISIAEESGFIIQIGEWVLKNVCRQSNEWKDKGYNIDHIGVNISPIQLKFHGFIDMVKATLLDSLVSTKNIEFEITENVLIKPFHQIIKILKELQYMGIKIALDDFGTGYSSLNYLRILPINSLKIDKTFIDNICTDSDVISIVDGIISLAHKMNLTVIAEGVETEEQFNILKEKQCDKIQGYFISRPLSTEEIEELFKKESSKKQIIC
jgi:diguanylate cyclase (GGDEF)-like protein/PAS domain S-box-containing protein